MPPRLFSVRSALSHNQPIRSMCVGPRSGRVYATAGEDCLLCLFSVTNENPVYKFGPFDSPVSCASFDHSEDFIAFGTSSGCVHVIDLDMRRTCASWNVGSSQISCIAFHPFNNEFLAVGDSAGRVFVLSSQERAPIQQFQAHRGSINCVVFSPDGTLLASAGQDRLIRVFQMISGECFSTIRASCPQFLSLDFHPVEMILAGCSDDRSVHLFSFDEDRVTELKGNFIIGNASPQCIKFSKDGKALSSCSSSVISVFRTFKPDFADHMQIGQKKIHDLQLYSTCIAVASSEGNVGTVIYAKTDDFRIFKKETSKLEGKKDKKGKADFQKKVIDGSNLNAHKKNSKKNQPVHPQQIKGLSDLQPRNPSLASAVNDAIYREFKSKRPEYISMLDTRKARFSSLYDKIQKNGSFATINEIASTGESAWEFVSILQIRPQTINFANAPKCIDIINHAYNEDPILATNVLGLALDIIGPSFQNNKGVDDQMELDEALKNITPSVVEAANSNIEEAKALLITWKSIFHV